MHIHTYIYLAPVHHLCCMLQCIAELFNMLGTCRKGGREAGAALAVAVYCQAQRSQWSRPGTGRKVTTIY